MGRFHKLRFPSAGNGIVAQEAKALTEALKEVEASLNIAIVDEIYCEIYFHSLDPICSAWLEDLAPISRRRIDQTRFIDAYSGKK